LGRHLVEAALAAGHEVTLFNRGTTNPDLFPDVEQLRGDRNADNLAALRGRGWDAAIDTCGYIPRVVRASAELLADAAAHYTFISTISVYADTSIFNMDESGPLGTLDDETTETVNGETYGPLKVLCERAAEAAMPGRVLHVRSGLIVGPFDPTDRFTYWPVRVGMGAEVLAPSKPSMPVQFIDARDQAAWIIRMIETRQTGVYNVTGPAALLTVGELLETCRAATGSDARFIWVDDQFLVEREVTPYTELPLWIPENYNGIQTINIQKSLAAGLAFRPLAATIQDTLAWNATRSGADSTDQTNKLGPLRGGMMLDREARLLAEWKQTRPAQ
jgi:2'-hydroxyisoflavone reductase